MPEPSPTLIRFVRAIDRFTDSTGIWIALLTLPLVAVVCYEVIARYGFNAPTTWAFDMTYMLYAALFMLGTAYALHKGAHVRTDFLYERWSIKTQGVIDTIAYIAFFFPAFITFFVVSAGEAYYSWGIQETSEQTPWRPLLWPFKMVVPVACVLLLIQGISETIKSLWAARTGIVLEHKEKIEI